MKLNISAKLIGGFLIIVVLLVAAAGIGWNGSNQSDAAVGLICWQPAKVGHSRKGEIR